MSEYFDLCTQGNWSLVFLCPSSDFDAGATKPFQRLAVGKETGSSRRRAQLLPRDPASAVYAVVVCPSVCMSVRLSVTSRCCVETTGRIELFLAWRFPSTYPTLCYKEIWASSKFSVPVLLSGTLSQTPDLETSPRQVDRAINKARRRRRRSSLLTTPIRQSTSRGCLLQVGQL